MQNPPENLQVFLEYNFQDPLPSLQNPPRLSNIPTSIPIALYSFCIHVLTTTNIFRAHILHATCPRGPGLLTSGPAEPPLPLLLGQVGKIKSRPGLAYSGTAMGANAEPLCELVPLSWVTSARAASGSPRIGLPVLGLYLPKWEGHDQSPPELQEGTMHK